MFDPISMVTKFAASITPKGWLVIGAVALLIAGVTAVVLISDNRDKRLIETAETSGESKAVTRGYETTLEQNGKANEAGNQVRDGRGNAVFDECVRSATPETRINCDAFRNEFVPD